MNDCIFASNGYVTSICSFILSQDCYPCCTCREGSDFELSFDKPGNERTVVQTRNPFPHVHYTCCCKEACAMNIFYFAPNLGTFVPPFYGPRADPNNIATKINPRLYSYKIITTPAVKRWWPTTDSRDILNLRKVFGFTTAVKTWHRRPLT